MDQDNAKILLAHEFAHLISINQKNLLRDLMEDVWLEELRSEYSATLLGYDDPYKGSSLEKRAKDFLTNPNVSLTEWLNRREDYAAVNLFGQYLVDHYGKKILIDSLQSNKVGIESLNFALSKNGYDEDFTQVFSNWLITLLVNDCSLGERYCYLNDNLDNFKIVPTIYYLPRVETIMSSFHNSTYWAGNWHRFIGGGDSLVLEFTGPSLTESKALYLLCDLNNKCSVETLSLTNEQKGKIDISGFDAKYNSLTLISFVSGKSSGFGGPQKSFSFSWQVTVGGNKAEEEESELILRLLAQIEELKRQIAYYQAKLGLAVGNVGGSCQSLTADLYFGVNNFSQVSCLQEFLKSQGADIYPEGFVTGQFFSLTERAVIRFQEKYSSEILLPFGLEKGTGYVGSATREKINQLLSL